MPIPHELSLLPMGRTFCLLPSFPCCMKTGDPRRWWRSPQLKEEAIGFKHGAQEEGPDPLPITNILLPFQERGQGVCPSGTSSSLTTVHRLPKPRAWEPAPLRDLLTSPRRLLHTERGRMGEKQDSSPPNSC